MEAELGNLVEAEEDARESKHRVDARDRIAHQFRVILDLHVDFLRCASGFKHFPRQALRTLSHARSWSPLLVLGAFWGGIYRQKFSKSSKIDKVA